VELLIVGGLILGAWISHRIGHLIGRRFDSKDEAFSQQLGLVRNVTLALVAFLIGFAFAGAGTRFIERADLIVNEANALGTAWLRADALPDPQRAELKAALREYTEDRVAALGTDDRAEVQKRLDKVPGLHQRMWRMALKGTEGNPTLMLVVLPPLNEVIDFHTTHLALARRHWPWPIMAVLLASVALSYGLVGFGTGRSRRHFSPLDSIYGVVLAIAMWMVIDLDYPRRGILQVSSTPLVETLDAMK
jgi:hypothetical protein